MRKPPGTLLVITQKNWNLFVIKHFLQVTTQSPLNSLIKPLEKKQGAPFIVMEIVTICLHPSGNLKSIFVDIKDDRLSASSRKATPVAENQEF